MEFAHISTPPPQILPALSNAHRNLRRAISVGREVAPTNEHMGGKLNYLWGFLGIPSMCVKGAVLAEIKMLLQRDDASSITSVFSFERSDMPRNGNLFLVLNV